MGSAQMRLVVTGLSEGVPNHPLQSSPAPSVYALAVKTNGVLGMGVARRRSRIAPATKDNLLSNACAGFPPPKIASEALLYRLESQPDSQYSRTKFCGQRRDLANYW